MEFQRRGFLQGIVVASGLRYAGCINSDSDDDFEPYLGSIVVLNYHSSEHSIQIELTSLNDNQDVVTDKNYYMKRLSSLQQAPAVMDKYPLPLPRSLISPEYLNNMN